MVMCWTRLEISTVPSENPTHVLMRRLDVTPKGPSNFEFAGQALGTYVGLHVLRTKHELATYGA